MATDTTPMSESHARTDTGPYDRQAAAAQALDSAIVADGRRVPGNSICRWRVCGSGVAAYREYATIKQIERLGGRRHATGSGPPIRADQRSFF